MRVTVLCDASYCPDYKLAGYGFWIACKRGKLGGGGQIIESVGDTNTAEMMAICNAIYHGVAARLIERADEILIQTDSLAAIDRLRGGRVVTITEQQSRVISYYQELILRLNLAIEFRHVKAHTESKLPRFTANRMCDKRAKLHMRKARATAIAAPHLKQILETLSD